MSMKRAKKGLRPWSSNRAALADVARLVGAVGFPDPVTHCDEDNCNAQATIGEIYSLMSLRKVIKE